MCGGPLMCGGPCSAEHVRTLVNPALTRIFHWWANNETPKIEAEGREQGGVLGERGM